MAVVFGRFELDPASGELRRDGQVVTLQAKPLAILLYLVANRERWVRKPELRANVWPDVVVSDSALASALHDLRRALGDDGRAQALVRTARGRGYRFVGPLQDRQIETARLEPVSAPGAGPPFVGREDVLALLEAALSRALGGEGGIVLLGGEAGIGKTRTADELRARARARGVEVVAGACSETGGAPPYWPWRQVLREILARRQPATVRAELGPAAARVAQLVPELRAELADGAPPLREPAEQARFALFEAVSSSLRKVAAASGLLVHLDDLHVADRDSLALLCFLARRLPGSRILVVAGARGIEASEVPAFDEVRAEVARLENGLQIPLAGLAPDAVRELVARILAAEPDAETLAAVMRRTDGNPFLIRELALSVAREPEGDRARSVEAITPAAVRDVARFRLRALSDDARRAIETAAGIGREFDLDLLACALCQEPSAVAEAISEAVCQGLVLEPEGSQARFAHVLLRDAIYEGQPASRRTQLHRRIGEAIEGLAGRDPDRRLVELAHHFALAVPAAPARRAIDHAVRAGRRAHELLAFAEAAGHFERALRLLEQEPSATAAERCDRLLDLGAAHERRGLRQDTREACRRAAALARQLGDGRRLAQAALGFVALHFIGERDPEGVRLLEEALTSEPPTDLHTRLRLLARLAFVMQSEGARERADELLAEAARLAERLGDRESELAVANVEEYVLTARDAAPEVLLATTRRRRRLAEAVGDRSSALWCRTNAAIHLLTLGDRAAAEHELELAAASARADGHVAWRLAQYRALRALAEGRLAEAEEATRSLLGLEASGVGSVGWIRAGLVQLYVLRYEQGRLAEIASEVIREAERQPDEPALRAWKAQLFAELDQREACRRELEGLRGLPRDRPGGLPRRTLLGILADVYERVGMSEGAAALAAELEPCASQNLLLGGVAVTLGPVSRLLGGLYLLSGRLADAERSFTEARACSQAMRWTLWERYAELGQARVQAARDAPGDRAQARATARAVLADARARGLVRLAGRAEDLIASPASRGLLRRA